eukprot:5850725-Pyramimonas_sp.AAC.1
MRAERYKYVTPACRMRAERYKYVTPTRAGAAGDGDHLRGGCAGRRTPPRPHPRRWDARAPMERFAGPARVQPPSTQIIEFNFDNNITSFYGSSCANNNGKDALNTPKTLPLFSPFSTLIAIIIRDFAPALFVRGLKRNEQRECEV